MILELGDLAQAVGGEDLLEGAEIGVVAAVLEDSEEFASFFGGGDQLVGFGGGSCEGFFDDNWGAMVSDCN